MRAPRTAAIHLDTSFLIRALVAGSAEADALRAWITHGRRLAMSAVAWGDFLCGPLDEGDAELASSVVRSIIALDAEDAALAARLFKAGGRRRGTFPDCLVAAACLRADGVLATANPAEFTRFAEAGLELVRPEG